MWTWAGLSRQECLGKIAIWVWRVRTWGTGPMAMHLEFVVLGPPISNQSPGINLTTWRATVAGEAQNQWAKPLLTDHLKAIIINFYAGHKPSVDVDNLSKPILDVMQQIIYDD